MTSKNNNDIFQDEHNTTLTQRQGFHQIALVVEDYGLVSLFLNPRPSPTGPGLTGICINYYGWLVLGLVSELMVLFQYLMFSTLYVPSLADYYNFFV